jgi:hypothetical protein
VIFRRAIVSSFQPPRCSIKSGITRETLVGQEIIEAVLLVDLLLESIASHLMQQSTISSMMLAKRIQQENRASCNKSESLTKE